MSFKITEYDKQILIDDLRTILYISLFGKPEHGDIDMICKTNIETRVQLYELGNPFAFHSGNRDVAELIVNSFGYEFNRSLEYQKISKSQLCVYLKELKFCNINFIMKILDISDIEYNRLVLNEREKLKFLIENTVNELNVNELNYMCIKYDVGYIVE